MRPVIDLKSLNHRLLVPTFKMETLFTIIASFRPQEWVVKVDFKDASHHILVHPAIRKYFWFVVQSKVYQFRVLLFGLPTAPQEFTKTLAPVVTLLRSTGVRVHVHLDDWLIRADSYISACQAVEMTIELVQQLGWTINWDNCKSLLTPSQSVEFLGLNFDLSIPFVAALRALPESVAVAITLLRGSSQWTAQQLSSLISGISHMALFIHPGLLHLQYTGGKHYQKITIVLQNFAIPGYFPYRLVSNIRRVL